MEGRRDQVVLASLAEGLTNQPGSSIHRPAAVPRIDELPPGHLQLVGTEAVGFEKADLLAEHAAQEPDHCELIVGLSPLR